MVDSTTEVQRLSTAGAKTLPFNQEMRVKEQVHTLYMQAPLSNVMIYIVAGLFYLILNFNTDSVLIVIWTLALVITASLRLTLWFLHKHHADRHPAQRWLTWYVASSFLVGLSWSLIFPLIYMANDIVVTMSLSMLVFGIAGAAVSALSVHLPAFVLYTYPQILTLIGTLFLYDKTEYYLLSAGIFIYLIMITLFTRNVNREAMRTIDLNVQNIGLIADLNEEVFQREELIEQRTAELNRQNILLGQEIEERQSIEQELQRHQSQLLNIFEGSPAGMALLDPQYRYTLINQTLASINGSSVEDHIGKSIVDVIPSAKELLVPLFDQIVETHEPVLNLDINGESPSRPGTISHLTASFFPILTQSDQLIGIGAVVIDISEKKLAEQALQESEERFQLAMRGANDGLYDWNLQDNTIYYSPRWKMMLGYAEDELPDDFSIWEKLIDPVDRKNSWHMLTDYIDGKRDNFHLEFKMQHKDGHWVDILSRAFLVRNENGDAIRVVGTHVDISEMKGKDERIHVFSQALEQSPVLVVITDTEANIEYVNRTFEKVTGYSSSEVQGKNPRIFQSGLTPASMYQDMWRNLLNNQQWSGEIQNRKKNGDIYWEHALIAPVLDPSGVATHYLAVKEDITEKKQQEEKIIYQAHYDHLTGLPNRFLALDRLTQALKEAQRNDIRVAVLFLDLDGFKRINDSLGHDVGDRLLISTAQRLSETIRAGDTLCRLGGDEFVLILQGLHQVTDIQVIAENLLVSFNRIFNVDDRELMITSSIGIALYPEDGRNSSELLRNADTAMYRAKELGRNTYQFYTQSMSQDVSRRLSIEQELFGALDNHQFKVKFQPLFSLPHKRIWGVEALLRWHSPVLGDVTPDEFIPIAEQTGAIKQIGLYVLDRAMAWNARWVAETGSGVVTAVNMSPAQFRDPELTAHIISILEKHDVPPQNLELEITEGVLMSGYHYVDETIEQLKNSGISISMDDFGTGYSSLSYLRSYPFSTLKIDRSFIHDINIDKADRELINAAISMGHGLGLRVVAEGVESTDQEDQLRQMQCDLVQGFLYSKPVDGEKVTELLKHDHKR